MVKVFVWFYGISIGVYFIAPVAGILMFALTSGLLVMTVIGLTLAWCDRQCQKADKWLSNRLAGFKKKAAK